MSRSKKKNNYIKKSRREKAEINEKRTVAVKRIVKIVLTILISLAVIALCAVPAVFMNSIYGYVPAMIVVAAIIISVLTLLILKYSVSMSTKISDATCERGGRMDVGLELQNRSFIASPKGIATMFVTDLFGGTDSENDVNFTLAARGNVNFDFGMDLNHIGVYKVGISRLKLYNIFGVASFTLPVNCSAGATVTPRIRHMDEFHLVQDVDAETDADTKTTVIGGYDYTGVREYAPGDPMKQIHWKLSSHSASYMTKIHESSRRQEFSVVLDFAAEANDTEMLMDMNDTLVEVALSLVEAIRNTDTSYNLLYINRDKKVERTSRAGRDDVIGLMQNFAGIKANPDISFPDGGQILQMEASKHNRSTNVIVVTSRITDELLSELRNAMRQRRAPELYYIIPSSWTSRDIENAAARLRVLDEMEIPYYMISTETNLKGN